jgi:hypothetical protein
MNNESERIRSEMAVTYFKAPTRNLAGETEENYETVKVSCLRTVT